MVAVVTPPKYVNKLQVIHVEFGNEDFLVQINLQIGLTSYQSLESSKTTA